MDWKKTEINIQDCSDRDWNYKINYKPNEIPKVELIHDNVYTPPPTLSKYYSFNERNVDAFLNNYFYLAQVNQMNDVFETGAKSFKFDTLTVKDLAFHGLINSLEEYEEHERISQNDPSYFQKVVNSIYTNFLMRFGILCTTSLQKDDLMWAHYSNNSGFLIEFDYTQFPSNFCGPFPINYCKKSRLDIKEMDWNLAFYVESLTKKDVWKYEHEYRFLFYPEKKETYFNVTGLWRPERMEDFNVVSRKTFYPSGSVKKIILGIKILEDGEVLRTNRQSDIIRFKDKNKISFFEKLSQSSFPLEAVGLKSADYEITTLPLKVYKVEDSVFEVEFS